MVRTAPAAHLHPTQHHPHPHHPHLHPQHQRQAVVQLGDPHVHACMGSARLSLEATPTPHVRDQASGRWCCRCCRCCCCAPADSGRVGWGAEAGERKRGQASGAPLCRAGHPAAVSPLRRPAGGQGKPAEQRGAGIRDHAQCVELYTWWSHLLHADDHVTNRISAHAASAAEGGAERRFGCAVRPRWVRMLQVLAVLFELGCIFHSVIIGVALGVDTDSKATVRAPGLGPWSRAEAAPTRHSACDPPCRPSPTRHVARAAVTKGRAASHGHGPVPLMQDARALSQCVHVCLPRAHACAGAWAGGGAVLPPVARGHPPGLLHHARAHPPVER